MEDAAQDVIRLQTQKKETQPKIDRLRDYEKRIEQHMKMQRVWYAYLYSWFPFLFVLRYTYRDEDFRKFNERADQMEIMRSEYKKMEMRLESYEKTQVELEEDARFVIITLHRTQADSGYLEVIEGRYKHWKRVQLRPTKRPRPTRILGQRLLHS